MKAMSATTQPLAGSWLKTTVAALAVLVAVNGALYVTMPELFSVDLAKGPYTDANNLELTRVYHRAIPLYEQIVADFPGSEYAILSRIGIARASVGLGQARDALEQYEILLEEGSTAAEFERHRYSILASMASIYRDLSDFEGHARIVAALEEDYPASDALKQEQTFLATRAASSTDAAALELPANFPFVIDRAAVVLPETVAVGDTFDVTITIDPAKGPTPAFSLMTNLGLWQGFAVEKIVPTPRSVAEFWGRRQWQFTGISEPVSITATLKATTAGTYEFDLDIETNYDITEIGIVHTIRVGD
jgi:hypothetical protein